MTSSVAPPLKSSRRVWIAVSVVVLVAVSGLLAGTWWSDIHSSARPGPPPIVVEFTGSPIYSTVLCTPTSPETFETFFIVGSVTAPLLTSEFTLSIVNATGSTISPNGVAPLPDSNLPCGGAPHPSGWYVYLSHPRVGAVASYPAPAGGGGPTWVNVNSMPQNVSSTDEFSFITVADFTGTDDRIVAQGIGGVSVELAGDTTFPPYHRP